MPGVNSFGPRRSLMDDVLQGVEIARSIYGIKSAMDQGNREDQQLELQKQDQARKQDEADQLAQAKSDFNAGKRSKGQVLQGLEKGVVPAVKGEEGAVEYVDPDTGLTGYVKRQEKSPLIGAAPQTKVVGGTLLEYVNGKWTPTYSAPAKTSKDDGYNGLRRDEKINVDELSKANGHRQTAITTLEKELEQFKNAKDEAVKVQIGKGMFKTLNSPQNPDALGAEESKRVGNFLEPYRSPLDGAPMFGRQYDKFEAQVQAKIDAMKESHDADQAQVDSIYGAAQKPPANTHVKMSNPKTGETLLVAPGDVKAASADGFVEVK